MAVVTPVKKPIQSRAGDPGSGPELVNVDRENGRFRVHRSAYKSAEVFEREKQLWDSPASTDTVLS